MLHEEVVDELRAAKGAAVDDTGPHVFPNQLRIVITFSDEVSEFQYEPRRRKVDHCDQEPDKDLRTNHVLEGTECGCKENILAPLRFLDLVLPLQSLQI